MDWYRYGSMLLPRDISVEEMRRECAFYQLPDEVMIEQKRMLMADFAKGLDDRTSQANRKGHELRAKMWASTERHIAAAIH
eukprot:39092-Amphidinium_carterae.1